MDHLIAIAAILLLGWFWLDSLRSREIATGICQAACAQRSLQLLDQAVALRRLGIRRSPAGLRWRRTYRFEFSEEGFGRRTGYLTLRGIDLEEINFGLPSRSEDA